MSDDKVRHIGTARQLKGGALDIFSRFRPASDAVASLDRPYLVKGWLEQGQVSVLYGPSGGGKTFLALNLAYHIEKGIEWGGRRVRQSRVLYISAEGGAGINNRVAVLGEAGFWLLDGSLIIGTGLPDARNLCDAIDKLSEVQGQFGMIIIDTLAKTIGAGDESSNRDMSVYLNAIELIRRRTRAHVMIIHHIGKTANGPRGAYALPAGVDATFELTEQEGGVIHCEAKKQRDDAKGGIFAYRLNVVELGKDQDGDPVTTCLVEPCEPVAGGGRKSRNSGPTGASKIALDALGRAIDDGGTFDKLAGCRSVAIDDWRVRCEQSGLSGSSKPAARAMAFKRAFDNLLKIGWIKTSSGQVWVARND